MDEKIADGWRYGAKKSAEEKTHPLLVPYSELPVSEKLKDGLVQSIIDCFLSKKLS
jgi:hypothetical protein